MALGQFLIHKRTAQEARHEIAGRMKQARLNAGLNQRDVAQSLSISQSTYSRMEKGKLAPDCAQIRVLSGLYNLSILWLLGVPNYLVRIDQSSSSF